MIQLKFSQCLKTQRHLSKLGCNVEEDLKFKDENFCREARKVKNKKRMGVKP